MEMHLGSYLGDLTELCLVHHLALHWVWHLESYWESLMEFQWVLQMDLQKVQNLVSHWGQHWD
jgi:hypothetical protein